MKSFITVLSIACFVFGSPPSIASDDTGPTKKPNASDDAWEIQRKADKAEKYLKNLDERFKHWMYHKYDLTENDELAGKSYPTTAYKAVLFSRHEQVEKYIAMHVEGIVSTNRVLRKKTDIWFDLDSIAAITPASGKGFCTNQVCYLRIRFDNRSVINVHATMVEKQLSITRPLPIVQELKQSKIARVEIVEAIGENDFQKVIYTFDVKNFQWNLKE